MNFRRSYASWNGQPKVVHDAAAYHRGCLGNADQAAKDERTTREFIRSCAVGDPRLPQAFLDLKRHPIEQRHWREYAAYWLGETRKAQPVPQDQRLPREPGDDDDAGLPW